jgi:hypothetical protein
MHPLVQDLANEVQHTKGIVASAVALINGINGRIEAAVNAAIGNGATAEQLAPLTALREELATSSNGLAEAVNSNS